MQHTVAYLGVCGPSESECIVTVFTRRSWLRGLCEGPCCLGVPQSLGKVRLAPDTRLLGSLNMGEGPHSQQDLPQTATLVLLRDIAV